MFVDKETNFPVLKEILKSVFVFESYKSSKWINFWGGSFFLLTIVVIIVMFNAGANTDRTKQPNVKSRIACSTPCFGLVVESQSQSQRLFHDIYDVFQELCSLNKF